MIQDLFDGAALGNVLRLLRDSGELRLKTCDSVRQVLERLRNERVLLIAQANVVNVGDGFVEDIGDVHNQLCARPLRKFSPQLKVFLHLRV